jgi:CheY-like chemotaxis protein
MASQAPILLVADDDDARDIVQEELVSRGYAVVSAAGGAGALRLILEDSAFAARLILLDVEMAAMSGWEFLTVLRSLGRLSGVPVVLIASQSPSALTLERGAIAAWLPKPVEPTRLVAVVAELLGRPYVS